MCGSRSLAIRNLRGYHFTSSFENLDNTPNFLCYVHFEDGIMNRGSLSSSLPCSLLLLLTTEKDKKYKEPKIQRSSIFEVNVCHDRFDENRITVG